MRSSYNTVLQQVLTMMKTPIKKLSEKIIVCDTFGLVCTLLYRGLDRFGRV